MVFNRYQQVGNGKMRHFLKGKARNLIVNHVLKAPVFMGLLLSGVRQSKIHRSANWAGKG